MVQKIARATRSSLVSLDMRSRIGLGILMVISVALAIVSPSLLAILAGIYLAHRVFSPYLSSRIFASRFFRFVVSVLLYTIILQCVIVSLWAVSKDFSLQLTPLITAAILLIILAVLRKREPAERPTSFFSKLDMVAVALAISAALIITVPSLVRMTYTPSNVLKLLNTSVDDAWHLSSVNDHLYLDRGVFTEAIDRQELRNSPRYPAGWHSLNAVFIRAAAPDISVGSATLVAYVVTKVVWFALLLYMVARVGLQLWSNYSRKKMSWAGYVAFTLVSLYFWQVFVHNFIEGFYSFVPQIMYGIIAVCLIGQLAGTKTGDSKPTFAQTILVLFVVAVGGNLAWFLPTPAFGTFLLLLIAGYVWGKGWLRSTVSLVRSSVPFLPVYLLIATGVLVQLHILDLESPGNLSFRDSLLVNGGVTIYEPFFYVACGIGLAAFYLMVRRAQAKDNFLNASLLFFVCLLVFASAVSLYQQVRLGYNVYYFYKLLSLLLALTLPLIVAGYAYGITLLANTAGRTALYAIAAVCLLFNFIGVEPTTSKHAHYNYLQYIAGKRYLNPVNDVIYKHLENVSTLQHYNDKTVFFTKQGGVIANVLLKTNHKYTKCFERVLETIIWDRPIETVDQSAKENCEGYTTYYIANDGEKENYKKIPFSKLHVIDHKQAVGEAKL